MAISLLWALLWARLEISAMVADSSWTALACSVAPCARAWAPVDTWSEPEETCSPLRLIWISVSLRLRLMARMDVSILASSPT